MFQNPIVSMGKPVRKVNIASRLMYLFKGTLMLIPLIYFKQIDTNIFSMEKIIPWVLFID